MENTNLIYIIPLYNKSEILSEVVNKLNTLTTKKIIFIENGSTDDSYSVCKNLIQNKSDFLLLNSDKGFGNALSKGLNSIGGTDEGILIITGADLPFGFSDVNYITEKKKDFDVCVGSKSHIDSKIERSYKRIITSKIFNTLVRFLFGLKISDTQGSTLINLKNVSINEVEIKSSGFFSNTELLVILQKRNYKISEIPISLYDIELNKSTVNVITDSFNSLVEMLKFRFKYFKDI